ncbi:DUF2625 family protein [Paenibacillus sp. GCM10012303]|uniref:DUF2625 family protein n=1 Tax=Paenibacillus sp. GCM10012303 TaxID=3317340 RepID=UPI00361308BD
MKTSKKRMGPDDAWGELQECIAGAQNRVSVLPCNREQGIATLEHLQLSNRSYLGAIALETGGLLIDGGWLKILGAGNSSISGSLITWNNPIGDALIVAYDLVGGCFALSGETGTVHYFAPDTLSWEDLEVPYSGFIEWVLNGDVALFYETFRWKEWLHDSQNIQGDQAFLLYPYLWTAEGKDVERTSRKAVGVKELWGMQLEFARQLNGPS